MKDRLSQQLGQLYSSDKLPWLIILIGITLRLIRYLYNPSLWFDESDTAVDIINRPFANLIEPSPDWSSKYPYGFLLLIKSAIHIFGTSEYALRLVPLLFLVLSVLLFYRVAKNHIGPAAVIVALSLFAIIDPLIFQSSNLKPYSGDLAFALMVFIWVDHIRSGKIGIADIALAGLMGAIMVWFSYPALFVLAGAGTCLAVFGYLKRDWSRIGKLAVIYLVWALSFIASYFIYIRNLISNFGRSMDDLLVMERAFVPLPPTSLDDIKWIMDNFFEMFNNPVGLTFSGIAAFAFLIGCISIFRHNKEKFYLLLSPILLTVLASIMHQYPFKNRLIVFLVPFMLLFIGEGVEFVRKRISDFSAVPGIVLIGVLFVYPVSWAAYHAKSPTDHEKIRPAISHIKNNWQNGDVIYVHYYSQYAFEYYTKHHPDKYAFDEDDVIVSKAPRGWYRTWRKQHVHKYYEPDTPIKQSETEIFRIYLEDMEKLMGRGRVWVLFSTRIVKGGMQEEKFITFHLDTNGKRIDFFGKPGAGSVYLYDLSGEKQMVGRK
jgi:hypothetical protein